MAKAPPAVGFGRGDTTLRGSTHSLLHLRHTPYSCTHHLKPEGARTAARAAARGHERWQAHGCRYAQAVSPRRGQHAAPEVGRRRDPAAGLAGGKGAPRLHPGLSGVIAQGPQLLQVRVARGRRRRCCRFESRAVKGYCRLV
jgi:hypothetical protein